MNDIHNKFDGYCLIGMLACFLLISCEASVKATTSSWWVAFMVVTHLICFFSSAASIYRDRIA